MSGDRENILRTGSQDATVFDDDVKDVLTGSTGLGAFFDDDLDRSTDLKDEIFANDLDFILS